jgi:hypothetical protein
MIRLISSLKCTEDQYIFKWGEEMIDNIYGSVSIIELAMDDPFPPRHDNELVMMRFAARPEHFRSIIKWK